MAWDPATLILERDEARVAITAADGELAAVSRLEEKASSWPSIQRLEVNGRRDRAMKARRAARRKLQEIEAELAEYDRERV